MSNNLRAILIDDEMTSLQNLKQKIQDFCSSVSVVAATQKPEEAILLIRELNPDVLFLDIEMPKLNGFRMLEELGEYDAEVIFTTAYQHYAVNAMRISAFDYLVKPVSIEELENAVARLMNRKAPHTRERMDVLKRYLSQSYSQENKIAVPAIDGYEFLVIKDILRVESSSSYSRIYFINGKSVIVTKSLKDFEDILSDYHFFRVHNSHLINLNYIKKYIRGTSGQILLENGEMIDVSRRKKEEFIKILNL